MSIPGLDWGVDEVMGKEMKKVPQKKVPYAKPIPAQFQQVPEDEWQLSHHCESLWSSRLDQHHRPLCVQAWAENKVPMMPPGGDLAKDRKAEQKGDMKKKTQAEMEQEMAALQYTNPMLLEVRAELLTDPDPPPLLGGSSTVTLGTSV